MLISACHGFVLAGQSSACHALPWSKDIKFGSVAQDDEVDEAPLLGLCLALPLSIPALGMGYHSHAVTLAATGRGDLCFGVKLCTW